MSKIVCFGEVLWDLLPSGKIAGGAPMNVAYHLSRFGYSTTMISRIGQDDLGIELLQFLNGKGVDTQWIQVDDALPTGIVKVTLTDKGQPSYEIVQPVAWDDIERNEQNRKVVEASDVFIYGSLAARNEISQQTLFELLDVAKFKVFDVNLRPPFYSKDLLEKLLHQANIVKMNDEELEIIGAWHEMNEISQQVNLNHLLTRLRKIYNLKGIIVTIGAKGAIYSDDTGYYEQNGFPITVQDTIGSGDSFLAGFMSQYLNSIIPQKCLEFACATGAYVATQKGGTPQNSLDTINDFIQNFKH